MAESEPADNEDPPILLLFHNISDGSDLDDSDINNTDAYGYSVLAVPKTIAVPYKLHSGKTTTTAKPLPLKFCGPHLALDWDVFPRSSKKVACVQAKPLQNLEDLAHTVDKHFVLAFPTEDPISPLESPPTEEETLIQLDCLLSWCCLVLKQLAKQQKNAGHMKSEMSNLQPREIGYQNPQSVMSQVANSSGLGVPCPKTIGLQSSLVETSEEGIRGNVHPETSEGS
ncbi:hypothetical protein DSO57_1021651 [Entomophthora muscae]|uniref:Uncharacterized protein n=1 Tax=Entomophthora muscae TaxID=34485 RepID=A0ACC2TQH5_9FUNG|nr:hypothetical protein DSO57_1021651 [Entomophthora muscae]